MQNEVRVRDGSLKSGIKLGLGLILLHYFSVYRILHSLPYWHIHAHRPNSHTCQLNEKHVFNANDYIIFTI